MSLFPAYASSVDSKNEDDKSPNDISWLTNKSCPPEVGQQHPSPSVAKGNETKEEPPSQVKENLVTKKNKADKHKRNSHGKKKKKRKKTRDYSPESNASPSRSASPFRGRSRSKSRRRSRSTSRSCSTSRTRKKHSRVRHRSRSRSRDSSYSRRKRYRSRTRSRSLEISYKRSSSSSSKSLKRSSCRTESLNKFSKKSDSPSSYKTSSEILVAGSKSVFLRDLHGMVKPEEAFTLDTSGDQNNLAFSVTHYSQLAKYNGIGKVPLGHTFTSHGSGSSKNIKRYFKRSVQKALLLDTSVIVSLPKTCPVEKPLSNEMYISLELSYIEVSDMKSERNSEKVSDSVSDTFVNEDDNVDNEKGDSLEYKFWQDKSKVYNQRLGKEPGNITLWIEFVRFQDKSFRYLFKTDDDKENAQKRKKVSLKALAERKISILDSAIKKNPRSLELQYERLVIGQDLWDDKKLKQEWGTLLFNFPNKINVWHQYLAFMETHFTSYNLSNVVNAFSKCTEKLLQIKNGTFITHSPPSDIGMSLVDITLQLAYVWKQAGYVERSVALFQALVELNLFPPSHVVGRSISLEDTLALFEPFWDSRAPRFGEEKALGWAVSMENRQPMEYPEIILGGMHDEEDAILARGGSTSDLWLSLESFRERQHWLPWEQDPEDCEDPERMVNYDDIASHLYILDTLDEKFYLLLSFFQFLGVPYGHTLLVQWRTSSVKGLKSDSTESKDIFKPLTLDSIFDDRLFGRTPKLDFLHDNGKEVAGFHESGPTLLKSSCKEYCTFVCDALQQASKIMPQPYKTELLVLYVQVLGLKCWTLKNEKSSGFETQSKDLKKSVKYILKRDEFRTCLALYQEYGTLEEIMDHYTEAETVYATALTLSTSSGTALDTEQLFFKDVMRLYTSYIHLEITLEAKSYSEHCRNNILQAICSLVQSGRFIINASTVVSGPVILRTKKQLQELLDTSLDDLLSYHRKGDCDSRVLLSVKLCTFLSLLHFFTVGFHSACQVFDNLIDKIDRDFENPTYDVRNISLPGEKGIMKQEKATNKSLKALLLTRLIEEYLSLIEKLSQLEHEMKGAKLSPARKRSLLNIAVRVAPEHSTFLLQFALSQTWRDLLSGMEVCSGNTSILTLVSRIVPHLQRTIHLFANAHEGELSCGYRLEKVLDKGVKSPPGRHCPLLWRIYLALVAVTRPSGLKDLIYRAISSCPGVKCLYMDCIYLMPDMLKEIVVLLGEKGIRIRLPTEELQVLTEAEADQEL
ncbi:hypothetical protein SK128_027587 [Halocaridina rubra]|uniref:Protein NRDE2 homolog n=1 Tax=Halocaridina rubra TaxID=373956 RepID=A0AAN8XA08_HALRR